MKEEFDLLTSSVSESECELICQRLIESNIKFELRDKTESFIFDVYGANSPLGKRIFVLNSDLEKARELLGIKKHNFFPSKYKVPFILKIIIFIIISFWSLIYIYSAFRIIIK